MNAHIRLNQPLIPLCLLALAVLQVIDPSRVWTISLVGLGGAWLAGYLWTASLGKNLHLKREMRVGWAQVGGQVEERFTLTNTSLMPAAWVEIKDRSTLPDYRADTALSVSGGGIQQWSVNGACSRRGLYSLGGTDLESGDPFGFFIVTIHDPASATLMVLPPTVPAPPITITPGGYSGEGRPRPNTPQATIAASSVREYQPGDSTRLIHWPTTARQRKLFVRLFEGAPAGDWWILLDLDQRVQSGDGPDSTEEHGVILAASLADHGLSERRAVGLAVNGAELAWLAPQRNKEQQWKILQALALARPGQVELGALLERARPALGRHASLIIITASTKTDWFQALIPLMGRGMLPTVLLLDPGTSGGEAGARAALAFLRGRGVLCHAITPDLLERPEARADQAGDWAWHYTSSGQFVPVRVPQSSGRGRREG